MDDLTLKYREIIEQIFKDYVNYLGEDEQVKTQLILGPSKIKTGNFTDCLGLKTPG